MCSTCPWSTQLKRNVGNDQQRKKESIRYDGGERMCTYSGKKGRRRLFFFLLVIMSLWRYFVAMARVGDPSTSFLLTCGRSRGHTTFLASSILVGNVFPSGRRSCMNCMFLLKLTSVHLFYAFIFRASSVTCKRVSCGRHPGYNGVFPSISICASLAFSLAAALALLVSLRSSS